jgi:hypothetical protein
MAVVPDQKFSTFQDGGDIQEDDTIVGLRDGINTRFNFPGAIPPGTIIQINEGGTGADNAVDARTNLGLGTMATQNANSVAITGGTADLGSGTVAASPANPTDIVNKAYLDLIVNPAALTKTDDTNVTLSLGGSPSTALLNAASLTLGWTGTLSGIRGGTGVNNGSNTATYAGNLNFASSFTTSGAFAVTQTYTGVTNVTFPTSGTLATVSQIPTGAALTRTNDTNVTLTLGGSPSTSLVNAASLTLGWTGILSKARGGTGVSSVTTAPSATEFAGWDANLNLSANNFPGGLLPVVSAAGTTTLTIASPYNILITGTTTQTIVMPVTSTLAQGHPFKVINNSSASVTLNSSGGNLILTMAANTTAFLTCVLNSGTTAASWNASYVFDNGAGVLSITGTANQVIASASTGAVILSLPQDIAPSSSPTFAGLTLTNPLSVPNGGTGKSSVTLNKLLVGNGTSALTELTPGANVLTGLQADVNTSTGFTTGSIAGSSGNFCKNLIIGGDFGTNPWQRGTSFPSIANTAYAADRWRVSYVSTAVSTFSQSADAPTVVQSGILTTGSLLHTITTADASIAAGDTYAILQVIEGSNFSRIAQRAFTLSFWVKANVTGIYCVAFVNSGLDRSYVAEYTINATNTWEYKTITVTSSPAAGTWDYTNGVGVFVDFMLACGSTFHTTSGVWQTGNFRSTSNQVNALATIGNTFQLALVQVEPGTVATPFEIRTSTQELLLCQRYFFKTFAQGVTPVQNSGTTAGSIGYRVNVTGTGNFGQYVPYPVIMRTLPSVTFYSPSLASASWYNTSAAATSGAASLVSAGDRGAFISNAQVAGDTISQYINVHASATAEL